MNWMNLEQLALKIMTHEVLRVTLLLAVILLSACSGAATATPTKPAPVSSENAGAVKGKVVPTRSVTLGFAAAGKVVEVLVKEGRPVTQGQVIARLEGGEQAQAAVAAAELGVVQAQQALDNLDEKAKVAAADAETTLAKAQTELKDAQKHRDDLNYARVNDYTLEGLQAQLIIAKKAVQDAEDIFKNLADLEETNTDRARALANLALARRQRDDLQRQYNYANGAPDSNTIAEADARLAKAKAAVENDQLEFDRRKNGPDPKDLTLAQASLVNAKAQLEAAKSSLTDLELTAPFAGVLVDSSLEVGQMAGPATPVVLGDLSSWKVETTDLKEADVVGILPGQVVTVHFDAIPGLELAGEVERIKVLGQTQHGDNTYTVYVLLKQQDPRLLWNMTAYVTFK
jgi:multidrug resistance efflux pump